MTRRTFRINRRDFLGAAAAAALAPLVVPAHVLGREGAVPPSEQLVMALIGYGNRGGEITGGFLGNKKDYRMVAVCDCYETHLNRGKERIDKHYGNTDCKAYARYEDVLDRADLDLVAVATPDHWHTKITVEACKAGKDVFCEKPLTLTPLESREIVAAARKYNRVCTSGSQRVMEDYGYMAPVIQSGAIGEVKEAFIEVGGPPFDLYLTEEPVPEGMDWDRWLGPAPWVPYHPERCSGSYGGGWRNSWDYGNGFLADWGAHKLGGVLYVLGIDHLEPIEILPPGVDGEWLTWIYPGGIKIRHSRRGHDITLVGSEREFRHTRDRNKIKPLGAVDVRRYNGGTHNLQHDFAYCVRNRLRPFQDLFYGATTATACQLGNITYKLNRPLKWDAEKTSFDDPIADRFVNRPKRSPYTIND